MNRSFITGIILLTLLHAPAYSQSTVRQGHEISSGFCISAKEFALYNLINEYRRKYNLPAIPLSKSLCFVANTHARDLYFNHPDEGDCNFHSWSDKGAWTPFCYPVDEDKKRSVWDKPKELTIYPGKGYEIVYWENTASSNDSIVAFWQSIAYFNNFLRNAGKWEGKKWNAIGIGVCETYACAWFGEASDPEGSPTVCGQMQINPAPTSQTRVKSDDTGLYYIIVKSMLPMPESEKLAVSLIGKGYPDAMVIERDGKTRVVIFKCSGRDEANQKLSEARKLYKDAWILVP